MVGCCLLLWSFSLLFFGPRLWRIIITSRNALEFLILFVFCVMLILFWLLTAYYISVVLFSFLSKPLPLPNYANKASWPEVAILYPTCNDFQPEAADSCLNQDYSAFHIFLLDDSTQNKYCSAVDAFHAAHPESTTVVRRSTRLGFKAGNLNHALRGAAANYPFFAVVDADERLPADFLRRIVPYLCNSNLAFVQANHAPNPSQDSAFARDIAPTLLPFWSVHCRPRNHFGYVLYLGHGAIVRRSAWEVVGGFPEVVLEDLAFSALVGVQGLRGAFFEDLVCYEDFPGSYLAFKRQQERYVIGTTQVMRKYLGALLKTKKISLIEKIDFILWCSPLYVPALCLVFIALSSLGLAGILGRWSPLTFSILGHHFVLPEVRTLDQRFAPIWSWDFQIFSVIGALSPAFACLALGVKGKLRAIKLLFLTTVPYLSLMIVAWRGILSYLLLGKTFSPPTGESVIYVSVEPPSVLTVMPSSVRSRGRAYAWRSPRIWEISLGGLFAVTSLVSFNLAHFAISCCLLIGSWIEVSGWEAKFVRTACVSCFAIILIQMIINITLLVQPSGLVPLVFSIHF